MSDLEKYLRYEKERAAEAFVKEGSTPVPAWDQDRAKDLIKGLLVQIHKQRVLLELAKISSSELDVVRLLEIIVGKSTEVVDADRSTLFLVDRKTGILWTMIAEGLEDSCEPIITIPIGTGIAGHVADTRSQMIIPDVYEDRRFDRSVDERTGYRTRNMVATPLVGSDGRVLGVLQVINKKDGGPFTREDADYLLAFASTAAGHVETAQLYRELESRFNAFIEMMAHAVDERDPCTAGHSRRVSVYSRIIGEEINRLREGPLATRKFSNGELRQLEIAALLHDIGKIGVREGVLNKRHRLTDEQLQIVIQRLDLELSRRKIDKMQAGVPLLPEEEAEVKLAIEFIKKVTAAGALSQDEGRRLWEIRTRGWLDDCEYEHLAVTRGNLTEPEWVEMQSHVTKSHQLLDRVPWPDTLQQVPEIAYCHHEKLNGKGYPRGLNAEQIPLEAQIVTVADIYDALTAHDRPYKPPMTHERAASILVSQGEEGFINKHVVTLFLERKLYEIAHDSGVFRLSQ